MAEALEEQVGLPTMALDMEPLEMSDEQFYQFCVRNPEWRIERTAEGNVLIMWPAGPAGSSGNAELNFQLKLWARKDKRGRAFDATAGFVLPNKAVRSPDAAWALRERIDRVRVKGEDKFLPLCPDFVAELRSQSDRMKTLHEKMEEYIQCGARLGWLLDPVKREVFVYRPGAAPEKLIDPAEVSGEDVLKGFVLDVRTVWEEMDF